jgi:hypothetical protein
MALEVVILLSKFLDYSHWTHTIMATYQSTAALFSPRITGSKHRSLKLHVCVSGNGQGVFLVVARVRFLVKPTFLRLAAADDYQAAIFAHLSRNRT